MQGLRNFPTEQTTKGTLTLKTTDTRPPAACRSPSATQNGHRWPRIPTLQAPRPYSLDAARDANSKGAKVKSRAASVVPPLLTQELAAASLSTNNKSKVR